MQPDLLDVVIRFHDPRRQTELDRCIFSLATQDHAPVRLHLVCQRFAPDALARVAERLAPLLEIAPDLSLSIVNREEPEPRDARSALINRGIAAARGRYLAFLDYDDVICPQGYRLLIGELARSGLAIAFGGIRSVLASVDGDVFRTLAKRRDFHGQDARDLFRDNFCPIHSFVIDRTKVDPAELYCDERLSRHEDYDLLIRLCARYPASFRHVGGFVGEYHLKDDGSNTVLIPSTATPERRAEWQWADDFLDRRRRGTLVSPAVQRSLGIASPDPTLTVARLAAQSRAVQPA